jgi:hypothetical protein
MKNKSNITKACCINHCVVWTVFPLVPRSKTTANARRYVLRSIMSRVEDIIKSVNIPIDRDYDLEDV